MIKRFICIFPLLAGFACFAQNDMPETVTPQLLQQLIAEVRQEATAFEESMKEQYDTVKGEFPKLSAEALRFSADTFKIEQLARKRTAIDYSTTGINEALAGKTEGYYNLMMRYFDELLKRFMPDDREVLLADYDLWKQFQQKETDLMKTLAKEQYSGGGTIQSNIIHHYKAESMKSRAILMFTYYDAMLK